MHNLNSSGDYVLTGNDMAADDTLNMLRQSMLLRLATRLGSYWADPSLGSKLHTIRKATNAAANTASDYVLSALQPLVSAGRIKDLKVHIAVDTAKGGMSIKVNATAANNALVSIIYHIKVGG